MIAIPREGGIEVLGSLQCPYYIHNALAKGLGLDPSRITVKQMTTGGAFGGKEDFPSVIALHAALLARRSGRPVKIIYDRTEDITATTKRHPSIVRHRTGVKCDGTIIAAEIDVVLDGGAYTTLTPVVLSRSILHAGGAYRVPNVSISGRAVATNTAPNGAFRGFGAPQSVFAVEMQINRIARRLGLDPLEMRRKNLLHEGDHLPGQILKDGVSLPGSGEGCRIVWLRGEEAAGLFAEAASDPGAAMGPATEGLSIPGSDRILRGIGLSSTSTAGIHSDRARRRSGKAVRFTRGICGGPGQQRRNGPGAHGPLHDRGAGVGSTSRGCATIQTPLKSSDTGPTVASRTDDRRPIVCDACDDLIGAQDRTRRPSWRHPRANRARRGVHRRRIAAGLVRRIRKTLRE
jgi:hypothetical protein